ncbi:MAG: hypothetical protein ABII09_04055 [Planctomycetota bacterium]
MGAIYLLYAYMGVIILLSIRCWYLQFKFVSYLRKKDPKKAYEFGCLQGVPINGILISRKVRNFIRNDVTADPELVRFGKKALRAAKFALFLFILTPLMVLVIIFLESVYSSWR